MREEKTIESDVQGTEKAEQRKEEGRAPMRAFFGLVCARFAVLAAPAAAPLVAAVAPRVEAPKVLEKRGFVPLAIAI